MTLSAPHSQDVIIVGGTGDLARRKLLPALYNLSVSKLLPLTGDIIALAHRDISDEQYRALAKEAVTQFSESKLEEQAWRRFATRLHYRRATPEVYAELAERKVAQRLVYLAVPPAMFPEIVASMGKAGLGQDTRVVFEKPFGVDLESARALDIVIHSVFRESQVFRIDHYLGKETVQNILMFRFANSMFERVWNRDAIDHVQITAAESIGIEGRGSFYEQVGALRDVVQNHVLQLLSVIAMEPPYSMAPNAIRDEKAKVFHAMRPMDPATAVRGQYVGGMVHGDGVPGYRQEPGVSAGSDIETYFAAKVEIDSWRWAGVPFYLRAGKRLATRLTEIAIVFKPVPLTLFEGCSIDAYRPNLLFIRIQPEEGIVFRFMAKQPGPDVCLQEVNMNFSYHDAFMSQPAEAYERLLHDAMDGDQTLFLRSDSVERAWEVVQPVLDAPSPVTFYAAGSWGPREADQILLPRHWALQRSAVAKLPAR